MINEFAGLSPPVQRVHRVDHRPHTAARQRWRDLIDQELYVTAANVADTLRAERRLNMVLERALEIADRRGLVAAPLLVQRHAFSGGAQKRLDSRLGAHRLAGRQCAGAKIAQQILARVRLGRGRHEGRVS